MSGRRSHPKEEHKRTLRSPYSYCDTPSATRRWFQTRITTITTQLGTQLIRPTVLGNGEAQQTQPCATTNIRSAPLHDVLVGPGQQLGQALLQQVQPELLDVGEALDDRLALLAERQELPLDRMVGVLLGGRTHRLASGTVRGRLRNQIESTKRDCVAGQAGRTAGSDNKICAC